MNYKEIIASNIVEAVFKVYGFEVSLAEVEDALKQPPNPDMGDFAFACFRLSKPAKKAPPAIAQELSAHVAKGISGRVEVAGPYLNFFIDRAVFARDMLDAVLSAQGRYGSSTVGEGKVVCIDYSSINIAKKFHIGHLSTTAIGNSLRLIFDYLGYQTVSINHLGDWGTQFGKLISAIKRWGNRQEIDASESPLDELTALYVRFHDEAEQNPALEDEARAWFKRIEEGDAEAVDIFTWIKGITMEYAAGVYDILDMRFDSYAGESFYNDKMGRVVDKLRECGLLKLDDGAYIVDLTEEKMPPSLILKRDGATLYTTRDIAAALYRAETYGFDKCLYVVAYQQDLHFRQWFKVVEKMGYDWAKDLRHVTYGMVSMEDGALSTRKGRLVYLDELLARSIEKTRAIIEEKSPELENKDEVARQVGVGAVLWSPLYNNRIKDIVFSWDRMLNFDGETAPYAMYTHARCCSVLRKAQDAGEGDAQPDYSALANPEAQAVIRAMFRFPDAIAEAADRCEPYVVARLAMELCQAYNKFYFEHRILGEEPGVTAARVRLTSAACSTLRSALGLLGIKAPERM